MGELLRKLNCQNGRAVSHTCAPITADQVVCNCGPVRHWACNAGCVAEMLREGLIRRAQERDDMKPITDPALIEAALRGGRS